jgi:hypothetical protein
MPRLPLTCMLVYTVQYYIDIVTAPRAANKTRYQLTSVLQGVCIRVTQLASRTHCGILAPALSRPHGATTDAGLEADCRQIRGKFCSLGHQGYIRWICDYTRSQPSVKSGHSISRCRSSPNAYRSGCGAGGHRLCVLVAQPPSQPFCGVRLCPQPP